MISGEWLMFYCSAFGLLFYCKTKGSIVSSFALAQDFGFRNAS